MLRDLAFETPRERRLRKEAEERAQVEQERLETEHRADIERKALELKADLAWLASSSPWSGWRCAPRPTSTRTSRAMNLAGGPIPAPPTEVSLPNAAASGDGLPPHDHNSPPVRVPPERPEESRDRTRMIRVVSRSLALIVPPRPALGSLAPSFQVRPGCVEYRDEGPQRIWIPPKTLQELHDTVGIRGPNTAPSYRGAGLGRARWLFTFRD